MCYAVDWSVMVAAIGILVSGFLAYKSWKASQKSAKSAFEARRSERLQEQMKAYRTIRKVFMLTGGEEGKEFVFFSSVNNDEVDVYNSCHNDIHREMLQEFQPCTDLIMSIDLFNDFLSCLLTYDTLFVPVIFKDTTWALMVYDNFTKQGKPHIIPKMDLVVYPDELRVKLSIGISRLMTDLQNYLVVEVGKKE